MGSEDLSSNLNYDFEQFLSLCPHLWNDLPTSQGFWGPNYVKVLFKNWKVPYKQKLFTFSLLGNLWVLPPNLCLIITSPFRMKIFQWHHSFLYSLWGSKQLIIMPSGWNIKPLSTEINIYAYIYMLCVFLIS